MAQQSAVTSLEARPWEALLSVLLAWACSTTAPSASEGIHPSYVQQLGVGWASNTVNTVPFRQYALLTSADDQYGAYYDGNGQIAIFQRPISSGLPTTTILPGDYHTSDAHNSISLGIDRSGYLHISYAQHDSPLRYRRSTSPFNVLEWTEELPMTGIKEDRVSYPTFLMPSGPQSPDLMFLYRYGSSGNGDACMKFYDGPNRTWRDLPTCPLAGRDGGYWTSSPYWNRPAIGPAGEVVLSFTWRTSGIVDRDTVNNLRFDYASTPDYGESWYAANGTEYLLPITPDTAGTLLAVGPGENLINQVGSALDSQGRLHIAFYSNDPDGIPQYQHAWDDGSQWRRSFVSRRTAPFDLTGGGTLQIPISRPEILIDERDSVYLIYRGDITGNRMVAQRLVPPDYEPNEDIRQLWGEDLGFAEPIVDHLRWEQDGILSMLIQRNAQPPHDQLIESPPEPVYLVDWDIVGAWE